MPCSRPNSLISIDYPRLNWLKTISLTAADTQVAYTGFVLERSFAGFPQLKKKMPYKLYVGTSNGASAVSSNAAAATPVESGGRCN